MAIRATSFAQRLQRDFCIHIAYRSANKYRAIVRFVWILLRLRPDLCYVMDMAFSGVLAAGLCRWLIDTRIVIDTGDAIYELSKNVGTRGRIGLRLTELLEKFAFSIGHHFVVRSHPHQELLALRGIDADVVPDGVDTTQFYPQPQDELRLKYGLEGFTVIGLLGSLIWNPRWQMCYGWELIEVMDRLRDKPVKALIVGDGSGLAHLKAQVADRELTNRFLFVGQLPYGDLPKYLNLMDVCVSTQTNDCAGQVRTTGKLPLYLACGRFVLASQVGEAARVLPAEMLVPYEGTKDLQYPGRLAERVLGLLQRPERLEWSGDRVEIARSHFDYDMLSAKLRQTILRLLSRPATMAPVSRGLTGSPRRTNKNNQPEQI